MEKEVSNYAATLNFISSLIWPCVLIWLILRFRPQVLQLFHRITTIKVAGIEVAYQNASPDAVPANPEAKVEISQIGPNGFFTAEGIRNIVSQSGQLPPGEKAISEMLLFDNQDQHTWLVASPGRVAIVLDDEDTRADNRLIQIIMDKKNVLPLKFSTKGRAGLVSFGSDPTRWYYSYTLYPTPQALEETFYRLIEQVA